jgi:hypothetical protein
MDKAKIPFQRGVQRRPGNATKIHGPIHWLYLPPIVLRSLETAFGTLSLYAAIHSTMLPRVVELLRDAIHQATLKE